MHVVKVKLGLVAVIAFTPPPLQEERKGKQTSISYNSVFTGINYDPSGLGMIVDRSWSDRRKYEISDEMMRSMTQVRTSAA